MKGRKMTLHDVCVINRMVGLSRDLTSSPLPPTPEMDWLTWMLGSGLTCNERIPPIIGEDESPYWIYLMAHPCRPPDWYRVFEVCNAHAENNKGENAFFYCGEHPEVIPYLLRAGVDWLSPSDRGHIALLNIAVQAHASPGYYTSSLCVLIDLYIEHAYDELAAITQWVSHGGLVAPSVEIVKRYTLRALDRRHGCRNAILTFCLYVRRCCGFPRDVAKIIAQLVWETRANRYEWEPRDSIEGC